MKASDSSLRTRAKSALLLAPPVLILIFFGGFGFTVMMAAIAGIAAFEWARMVMKGQQKTKPLAYLTGILTGLGVLVSGMISAPGAIAAFFLALAFLAFAYCFSERRNNTGLLIFGIFYIGFALSDMVWVRMGTSTQGLYHLMTLLLIVWSSDTAAYFTGKAIGGPKLAPSISPKKTWAGFFGSSLGSALVAAGMACPWVLEKLGVETIGGWGPWQYAAFGALLGVFGQAGDLFISMFKRKFEIKDTGNLIPGHGGILDRIDALLLVGLLFCSMTRLLG